ncbi:portal protein [Massilia sp. ZL223]|uniref:portal protein n=1 Tax=Massilia sp. ZL223 TaxID=2824904 RepID=UPI001B8200FF|nr:portal protein [Massilia sp. ZL223]MBQ5963155.1 hypothetical protein [Massilia sp. ZL223]
MSRPTSEQRLANKHAFFRSDFDKIQAAVRDVRIQCLSDRRFYSIPGAQWEGPVGEQFENKPRFEFNKTHLAVLRVVNEYRNNRITVDFVPKDGSQADELADTCDGLFRADEQDSGAQEAYDNCFEEGTSGGMGAIRLRARYENEDDDEDDRQRIAIEPIYEADTCVFFSLDGKRYDKADAKRCYVLSSMAPTEYEEEWDDDLASWPKDISHAEFDWNTPDVVWIAEVYEIEEKTELVHFFRGIALGDDEANELELTAAELDQPGKLEELTATGFKKVREKRRTVKRVHKYIMNGARILSDEGYIAGTCIPVIPYYGKRWYVDGIERCQGHVRLARDAQVLDNMIKSWLAEMASRFDIEKPIFTPEQIAGHAQMWADDAVKKYPFLLVNPILDAAGQQVVSGPVAYTKAPNMPPAMAALAQLAGQALEDMLGNQQAGEQLQPNQSGKAVELIQQRLDMQVFIYIDNFKKTVKRMGEVWQSMAKDLLVEPGRRMKTVDNADQTGTVELQKPMVDADSGEAYLANDLSRAKFDVVPDVGPSSSSRRAATVRALTGMLGMTADPETQTVLTSMVMMNMEGEGMNDVRAFYRNKLVRMGVIEPTEEEKKQLAAEAQNQKPDPNAEYLAAAAAKAKADEALAVARVGETHAKTVATLVKVQGEVQAGAIALADALTPGPIQEAPAKPATPTEFTQPGGDL